MVAFDPDPLPPGLHPREPQTLVVVEAFSGCHIIETVAEADYDACARGRDVSLDTSQRLARLIRWQHPPAAPGDAVGLAKVQVRDAERAFRWTEERPGGQRHELDAGQGERARVHASFMRDSDWFAKGSIGA